MSSGNPNCLFCFKRTIDEILPSFTIRDLNIIKFICKQLNVDLNVFEKDCSTLQFPVCLTCNEVYVKEVQRIYDLLQNVKVQLKTLMDNVIKEVLESYEQEDTGGNLLNPQAKALKLFRDDVLRAAQSVVKLEPREEEDEEEFKFLEDVVGSEMEAPCEVKVEIRDDRDDEADEEVHMEESDNDSNSHQEEANRMKGSESEAEAPSSSSKYSEKRHHESEDEDYLPYGKRLLLKVVQKGKSPSSKYSVKRHHESEDEDYLPYWKRMKVLQKGNTPKYKWACELCENVSFDHGSRLQSHNQRYHSSAKLKYKCSMLKCNKRFSDKNLYTRHIKFHEDLERFPDRKHCLECDVVLKTEESWEIHQEQHRTSKKLRKKCRMCVFASKYPSMIRKHEIEKHPDQLTHLCSICQEKYSSSSILEVHMKTHAPDGPYTCSICQDEYLPETEFPTAQDLEKHLLWVHIPHKMRGLPPPPTGVSCETCGRVFQDRSVLRNHRNSQHSNGQHKVSCEVCPEGPKSYLVMVNHVVQCHETDESTKSLQCTKCPKKFATNFILERHTHMHKKDKTKPIICELCEGRFASDNDKPGGLQFHIERFHKGTKPRWPCRGSQCDKTFLIKIHRNRHEREIHPDLLIHYCPHCDKVYQEKEFLSTHLKTHPEGDEEPSSPPFTCEVCKISFAKRDLLADHLLVHTGEWRLKCPHCPYQFMYQTKLNEHVMQTHTEESQRPHECQICMKKFVTKARLNTHLKEKHGGPEGSRKTYSCDLCGKILTSSYGLNSHKNNIHGPGENTNKMKEMCELCGKSVSKSFFKTHMQLHEGTVELKEACTYCDKKFRTGFELNLHTLTHTGEKPHTCHVCYKGFTQRHSWKKHLEVHKKDGTYFDP